VSVQILPSVTQALMLASTGSVRLDLPHISVGLNDVKTHSSSSHVANVVG
jgi:hypothetical protein